MVMTPAAKVLDDQLLAYNAGDIDKYVGFITNNIEIKSIPSHEMICSNAEEVAKQWGDSFAKSSRHCTIINRITKGDFVVDHEEIKFPNHDKLMYAVAINKVIGGLICKTWFIRSDKNEINNKNPKEILSNFHLDYKNAGFGGVSKYLDPELEVFWLDDNKLLCKGINDVHREHQEIFHNQNRNPKLTNQIVYDNFAIENIQLDLQNERVNWVLIYEFKNNLIKKIWII